MNIVIGSHMITIAHTKLPDASTLGITNETEHGFMPFLDYDDILYYKVVEDVKRIQREFMLGPAIILSTEEKEVNGETVGNYLVVWLDQVNHGLCEEITKWARCDRRYRTYWKLLYQKNWVIRIGRKMKSDGSFKPEPKFKELIPSSSRMYRKSRAYYLFYRKHFKIPIIRTNFTHDKTVTLIPYLTTK